MTEYVTIETQNGPVRLPRGMSREEMAEALNKLNAPGPSPTPEADMSVMGRIKDNVVGVDDGVESPGERLGTAIRGGTAAVARGIADIPALPANLAQLGVAGYQALTGKGEAAASALEALPDTRDMLASVPVIGPESQFVAPGKAGEYISTIGEFAGGAGAVAGPGAMLRYGALPGAASEAAGQATEGTEVEPYARIAAALGTSVLAGKPTGRARPVFPRADADDAQAAETLMRSGVTPTVGQVTGSSTLRRAEGSLDMLPQQADDFTRAAIRTTGSNALRATPEAMRAASDDIVKVMDDAVAGVSFTPDLSIASRVDDVVATYVENTPNANLVPKVKNIADEIVDAATSPNPQSIPLETLKSWRSRIGSLLSSKDTEVRQAAWGLRSIIDDATEQSLAAAGRAEDVAKLQSARTQYRNFLAVADASTRAGAESGRISPTQLNQSVIRSQGRRNAAVGNTTELGPLARAGAGLLRSEPTVSAGGVRTISAELGGAGLGGVYGAQAMPQSPAMGAIIGALAGSQGVRAGQAAMRSAPVQSTMMDPVGKIIQSLLRTGAPLVATTGN